MLTTYQNTRQLRSRQSQLVYFLGLLLAVAFGYTVATAVFHKLESDPGTDVHVYAALYQRYSMLMEFYVDGVLDYVLREVHFHFLYEWLSEYLNDPYSALQVLAFICSAAVLFYCMDGTFKKLALSVLILSHPRALDMLAGAQRMGLALTIFVIATKTERLPIRYALFVLAMSFHTYMVVMVGSYLMYEFLMKTPTRRSAVLGICASVVIVLVTVVLRDYILAEVGDRRSGISTETTGVLYTTMWMLTGLAIHFFAPRLVFTPYGALFYMLLLSGATAVGLGLYAERYIAIAIVILAASNISPKGLRLAGLYVVYGINLGLSYYYWLQQ